MSTDDKFLAKIAGLLRQAEGTDNPHEAEAFAERAQRLSSIHSIDLAVARAYDPEARKRSVPEVRTIVLGTKGQRGLRTYATLFLGIGRANDLKMDIAHNSTSITAFGFPEDINVTEALYASLVVQMVNASNLYLASGEHASETVYRKVAVTDEWGYRHYEYQTTPVPKITARLNFQEAFAHRVADRLADIRQEERDAATARDAARQAAEAAQSPASASTEIALIGKEVEVSDFYNENSKARGVWRGNRRATAYASGARKAGDAAGAKASLGGGTSLGGAKAALR